MPSLVRVAAPAPAAANRNPPSSSTQNETGASPEEDSADPNMVVEDDDPKASGDVVVESNETVAADADDPSRSVDDHDTTTATTTPKSRKRKVTPRSTSESKQTQQKKANQLSLSSFFLPAGSAAAASATTPPVQRNSANRSSIGNTTKKRKAASNTTGPTSGSVLEKLSSASSPPYKDVSTKSSSKRKQQQPCVTTTANDDDDEKLDANKHDDEEQMPVSEKSDDTHEKLGRAAAKESVIDLIQNDDDDDVKEESTKDAVSATSTAPTKSAAAKKSAAVKPKTLAASNEETPNEPPKCLTENELDEEKCTLYNNYRTMRERYQERAAQLIAQAKDGIEEESYETPDLEPLLAEEGESLLEDDEFPTRVVTNMCLLIEGSSLPLSILTSKVCKALKETHSKEWPIESVSAKIKVLAQRKAYFDTGTKSSTPVDIFEDAEENRLWRWEITTLDVLPSETVSSARKARSARKKVGSYHSAVLRLLKSLDEADTKIFDPKQPIMDNVIAKVSRDEEKVLKYEREAEKQRLVDEAKTRKHEEQEALKEAKQKAKEEAAEKKRLEKEEAAEKKRREKEEAAQVKEDAKRKKEEEKEKEEQAKLEEKQKKQKTLAKQKNSFISFFGAPQKAEPKTRSTKTLAADTIKKDFDAETFRSKINSSTEKISLDFGSLSSAALSSRKRRTKRVPVMVYTTVASTEEGWDAPTYAEQKTILVPNKYRFLSFHEDCRPAYHGTWSKISSIVTGKTPFGMESKVFDYEYDSEAEWEEGDDEVGEDVDDDDKNQEEDADEGTAIYDYEDGFCVADDKMLDNEETADDETRAMYKKKVQSGDNEQKILSNRICIIAPGLGGFPLTLAKKSSSTNTRFEGLLRQDVANAVKSYQGETLYDLTLCLDAFPQLHMDEEKQAATAAATQKDKDEYTSEAMIAMARFVHHSMLNSKEKVVEELRSAHPSLFSIRAKAIRKLDSIATKQKHPTITGIYYWVVKEETLVELGLLDLVEKELVLREPEKLVELNETDPKTEPAKKKRKRPTKDKANATKPTKVAKSKTKSKEESPPADDSETPRKKSNVADRVMSTGSGKKGKQRGPAAAASIGMKNLMAKFLQKK